MQSANNTVVSSVLASSVQHSVRSIEAGSFLDNMSTEQTAPITLFSNEVSNTKQDETLCRSTSAKPAVRRSPQQRTPQVHLAEVRERSDTLNLHTNS